MHQIISFIHYFLNNVREHSLHSPFIYDVYTKAIKPSRKTPPITQFENIRRKLVSDHTVISLNDLGTGNAKSSTISNLAKKSLSKPKKSNLLLLLGNLLESQIIVELGTSLGVNALYLSKINKSKVYTFEGDDSRADIAEKYFTETQRRNIELRRGNIDKTLMSFLNDGKKVDMVFFDANHAYEPTLKYFNICLPHTKDTTVFVFDDIYYSKEMTRAWNEICKKVDVTISLDLFSVGIVFFDPSFIKKHYILEW